ncbi:MAG: hypothetical protein WAJ88_00390 [Pseudolabrys sp.]
MSYSTPLFWLEMAVLICCVALSIKRRSKPAIWVALGIVAHCAIWLAMHDEEILIRLVAAALVYLGLLKLSPHAARVWLCAGGALAGAFLLGTTALSLLISFPSRWSVLGLSIGTTLLLLVAGLLIGFWVVYRWTEPTQFSERQPRQEA